MYIYTDVQVINLLLFLSKLLTKKELIYLNKFTFNGAGCSKASEN